MKTARPRNAGVRWLAGVLCLTVTMLCVLKTESGAMLAPARLETQAACPGCDRPADMKAVQAALESKVVQQQLKAYGLSDREVSARLAKLSDAQVHQLAVRAQAVSAGGDDGGAGFVVGLLLITALVLLIVYLVKRI